MRATLEVGDSIRCKSCGHVHTVDEAWLDETSKKFRADDSTSELKRRLRCRCGVKGCVSIYSINQQKIDYKALRAARREGSLLSATFMQEMEELAGRGNTFSTQYLFKVKSRQERLNVRSNVRSTNLDQLYGRQLAWSRRNAGL